MIHIKNNTCPVCMDENFNWNLNYIKSDIELFKCGHGTCKDCYKKMSKDFKCCICRSEGQKHTISCDIQIDEWKTFNEWYTEYEIYIKSGCAKNIINNTSYGKQLKRLYRESKKYK